MPEVRHGRYSTSLNTDFMVDLNEICGTGVYEIGIMIYEGYAQGSASLQTNASTGVAWQLVINIGGGPVRPMWEIGFRLCLKKTK